MAFLIKYLAVKQKFIEYIVGYIVFKVPLFFFVCWGVGVAECLWNKNYVEELWAFRLLSTYHGEFMLGYNISILCIRLHWQLLEKVFPEYATRVTFPAVGGRALPSVVKVYHILGAFGTLHYIIWHCIRILSFC